MLSRLIDMDEHWAPSSYYCSNCGFHYDYIIRYENFDSEMPYLWNKVGHKVSDERDRSYKPFLAYSKHVNDKLACLTLEKYFNPIVVKAGSTLSQFLRLE